MTFQPPPTPVPVATLAYQTPPRIRRPGNLTAVGVLSIVFGSFSGLSSFGGVLSGIVMLTFVGMRTPMPILTKTASPVAAAPNPIVTVDGIVVSPQGSPDGMEESQRRIVIEAVCVVRPITSMREKHLNLLLENSGKKMFPFVNETTRTHEIVNRITAGHSTSAVDAFDLETGSLRLTDGSAIFRANDKQAEVVQANAGIIYGPGTSPRGVKTSGVSVPTTTRTVTVPAPFPFFRISRVTTALTIGENVVSLVLAIVLFISGIRLVRDSPKFLRGHWIFICGKIPLVIFATALSWVNYATMMGGYNAPVAPGASSSVAISAAMILPSLFVALVTLAYPVALIFILSSDSAKVYHEQLRRPAQ